MAWDIFLSAAAAGSGSSVGIPGSSSGRPSVQMVAKKPGSRAVAQGPDPAEGEKTVEDFLPEAQKSLDAAKAKYGPSDAASMALSRKQALKRLEGLEKQVEDHIPKVTRRGSEAHIQHEIENWLKQMENAAEHVGEKTGAEWTAKIAEFRRRVTQASWGRMRVLTMNLTTLTSHFVTCR